MSSYGALILFQKKEDTPELRMCLDYCALNKKSIKISTPYLYWNNTLKISLKVDQSLFKSILKVGVLPSLDRRRR